MLLLLPLLLTTRFIIQLKSIFQDDNVLLVDNFIEFVNELANLFLLFGRNLGEINRILLTYLSLVFLNLYYQTLVSPLFPNGVAIICLPNQIFFKCLSWIDCEIYLVKSVIAFHLDKNIENGCLLLMFNVARRRMKSFNKLKKKNDMGNSQDEH